jgi:hypothetical protein
LPSFSLFAQQCDSLAPCCTALSSSLQINFINESALYYQFKAAETSSIRIGFSLNLSYSHTKPSNGEDFYYYTGSSPDSINEKSSSSNTARHITLQSLHCICFH